jgi:hypothetical protein
MKHYECVQALCQNSGPILGVGDLLHPVDASPVQRLRDCDMRHCRGGGRAVPVSRARREPDDVAGKDIFLRAAFHLHPAAAGGDDQRLAQRMGVPGGARAPGSKVTVAPPIRAGARP